MPDISRLPHYILRLACDVDWKSEQPCFEGVCRETAKFFSFADTINNNVCIPFLFQEISRFACIYARLYFYNYIFTIE